MKPKNHQDSAERRYELHIEALDLMEAGNTDGVVSIIQRLWRFDPNEPHLEHLMGFMLSELGLQNEAIPRLRRSVEGLPTKSVPRVTLGIALMRTGQLAEAEHILAEALALDPNCFDSMVNLAACLLAREKSFTRAERLLRDADRMMPDDQIVLANLGRAIAKQGRGEEADQVFRRAIALDPKGEVVEIIRDFYPRLETHQ
jgi:Flp pilus assembly protein TadD